MSNPRNLKLDLRVFEDPRGPRKNKTGGPDIEVVRSPAVFSLSECERLVNDAAFCFHFDHH